MMRIVFMGTPEFAAVSLRELIKSHEVTAVVTQPDRPAGRGKKLVPPPVKVVALSNNIEVYQPPKIRAKEFREVLSKIPADIFVVAAYGQLLPKEILEMPKYGAVNVHASLLPKYRGAAPIQWAIINGEAESGITIMQMDEGLDTGPMLLKETVAIEPHETGESLHDKLADIGAEALVKALELIASGEANPIPQDDALSTYAPMLSRDTGQIDWSKSADEIERLIRGLYPWPSAFSYLEGFGNVKIVKAAVLTEESEYNKYEPGTIIDIDSKKGFLVSTGSGILLARRIQVSGKKEMDVSVFLLGNDIQKGGKFICQ